jgi:hypothetical protein
LETRKFCYDEPELFIVGSSANGFGLEKSDLDMTLVLPIGENPQQSDPVVCIEKTPESRRYDIKISISIF